MKSMLYDLIVFLLAAVCGVGVVAAWRCGVRDGLRMGRGAEPGPVLPEREAPRAPEAPAPEPSREDAELHETLQAIDKFDGWKV